MFLMTARISRRRILAAVCCLLALVCAALYFLPGAGRPASAAPVQAGTNEERIAYLSSLGWKAAPEPSESMQVRIPRQPGEVFLRYNELQKSQGFDLSRYAGKQVLRCVYTLENFPGASEPVHATLLIYRDKVIGGDITDTSAGGKMQGLIRSSGAGAPEKTAPSAPTSP